MRKTIDKTVVLFIQSLLAFMLFCVVWQVLARYILPLFAHTPEFVRSFTSMTLELSNFGLIWLGVIGAGYVTGLKKHLAIDLLSQTLPPKKQCQLGILIEIFVIAFAVLVMINGGYSLMSKVFSQGQLSPVMRLPMGWVYLSVPLSGMMVTGYSLANLKERIDLLKTFS